MESPCVDVCQYFPGTRLCMGCLRTGYEIAHWEDFTDDERREVIAAVQLRREERGE